MVPHEILSGVALRISRVIFEEITFDFFSKLPKEVLLNFPPVFLRSYFYSTMDSSWDFISNSNSDLSRIASWRLFRNFLPQFSVGFLQGLFFKIPPKFSSGTTRDIYSDVPPRVLSEIPLRNPPANPLENFQEISSRFLSGPVF